ncbi:amidohydrolase family protein [Treponema phagedenis]|uniref:amidohydrolase family protein n=1 Tax=Treponema phagedenis TaxID=162 RepID=UPI0004641EF2|nr:amidohydrolase family protein [Treponema phagedenis]
MTDNHIHIGTFYNTYYDAKTVFGVLKESGVDEFYYSSTTSGMAFNTALDLMSIYEDIKKEITEAQAVAESLSLKAHPLYWVIPELHYTGLEVQTVLQEIPYEGFKLHPRANKWDLQNSQTRDLAHGVFKTADELKLPVLIHTGYDDDRADLFEEFFASAPNAKIILAHCRPLETTLRLLGEYKNVFCDTAFVSRRDIKKICSAGFTDKILFGSDFPITFFLYHAYGKWL